VQAADCRFAPPLLQALGPHWLFLAIRELCHIVIASHLDRVSFQIVAPNEPDQKGVNMRLLILLTVAAGIFFSGGCALHQVKGEVAGVEVEARITDAHGHFCPPGQAKKGNC